MSQVVNTPKNLTSLINDIAQGARNVSHKIIDKTEKKRLLSDIKKLLSEKDSVLVCHYYVDYELQDLADSTGGIVADSLEMARFAFESQAKTVIIAGVRFMGETAKILSPEKRILLIEDQAECSLDIGCPIDEFSAFCDQHPDRTVVVYANTSAAVKARADWVVTSSIALEVCTYLKDKSEKILWAPDRFLGSYIERETGVDMIMWQGSCIVHEEFKAQALEQMKKEFPNAAVLVHPESAASVVHLADVVGSTSRLLSASEEMPNRQFIVATEEGIFHKMKQLSPNTEFFKAPTAGDGATCISCAQCPWMKMNDLQRLYDVLKTGQNEITIDEGIRVQAEASLKRMVQFAREHIHPTIKVTGNA